MENTLFLRGTNATYANASGRSEIPLEGGVDQQQQLNVQCVEL
jgi:hypothetical protein